MAASDGFGDLLHQAQQLTASLDVATGGETMPRVERNLDQIREAAAKLAYSGPYSSGSMESTDVRASLLLGSRGYDVQKATQTLDALSSSKTLGPLKPISDTDIQGFLKNERENALLIAIERTRGRMMDEISGRYWDSRECNWEREKQKILAALGSSDDEDLDFMQQSQLRQCAIPTPMSLARRSAMDCTEMAYSKQVYVYNEHVVQGGVRPSLVDKFTEVASKTDNANVSELWSVVQHMVNVPQTMAEDQIKLRTSPVTQAAFIKQALLYLEKSYVKYIDRVIYGNMQTAQLGGVPGTLNIVKSFLKVRPPLSNMDIVDGGCYSGLPVWAVIFYCLRCGDVQATAHVVQQSRQVLGDFVKFFEEYSSSDDRRLSVNLEAEIKLQYRRSVHSSLDPYKRAVYCIVGRCDPRDDHDKAAISTDDYLWIKLRQLTVDEEEAKKAEKMSFTQFQTMLLEEWGETHFQAYQQPYLYFRVLFLTAQFEAAIEFLSRVESFGYCAVHIALVLYEMRLLLTINNIHSPILSRESSDPVHLRRLNFVRLIIMYTRKFEITDPREALEYFYFLRDIKTSQGEDIFLTCVCELVLETREFEMLLGQLQTDGSRRPGAVDKFKVDMSKMIDHVAKEAENKGQLEDAVKLYDLAANAEKVLGLLNRLLSQSLSQPSAEKSNKDRLKDMAFAIARRYKSLNIEGGRSTMITFHLQLDLLTFFDLYHSGQYERAYSLMQELNLLPFSTDVVDQKVATFRNYTDEIRRNIPDILLATMTLILNKYRSLKGVTGVAGCTSPLISRQPNTSCRTDDTKLTVDVNYIRSQAQALIMFAGMIPYRMPGDTNSRLVSMEVLMH